jgi:hypothetical protein
MTSSTVNLTTSNHRHIEDSPGLQRQTIRFKLIHTSTTAFAIMAAAAAATTKSDLSTGFWLQHKNRSFVHGMVFLALFLSWMMPRTGRLQEYVCCLI